jgi:hypothetical protein
VQESVAENSAFEAQVIQLLQQELIPLGVHHIVAIGTQECQTTITKSFFFPKKQWWENMCHRVLGKDYEMIRAHSLQATHLYVSSSSTPRLFSCISHVLTQITRVVFAHKAIHHLVTQVQSHAVATGIMDTLGNKGGIGISMNVQGSSFCFLTSHLAAHSKKMDRRTDEFVKISKEMSLVLGHHELLDKTWTTNGARIYPTTSMTTTTTIQYPQKKSCFPRRNHTGESRPLHNPLMDDFDFIFWAGDFNYRIVGSRDVVDTLLDNNRHDVLWNQDQVREAFLQYL